MTKAAREIVLVTGLSGAGKASILRVLEDLGFETVDNPPISILESLVGDGVLPLAAGIDARTRDFDAAAVLRVLDRLRLRSDINVSLVFATAEDEALLRRYTESRRRHPLAPGGPMGSRVLEGIAREKALLEALRDTADLTIDTSDLPLADLRRMIEGRFAPDAAAGLAVLDLLEGRTGDGRFSLESIRANSAQFERGLRPLEDSPMVGQVRRLGMMAALELVACKHTKARFEVSRRMGKEFCEQAISRGLWLRPLGDVVPILPAVKASAEQLDWLGKTLRSIFSSEIFSHSPHF